MVYNYVFSFIVAFAVAFVATPFVKKLAFRIGAVDVPSDNRRIHKEPIARLGGLAIFFGFLASFIIYSQWTKENIGLILGAVIIGAIGVIDDVKQLSAKVKLVFQVLAAGVVVYSGVAIHAISNPFSDMRIISLDYYGISIILTILWIVGVTNAVNFIDGLDGLAAGVTSIASMFLMFIAIINGLPAPALLTAAVAGATLGFLPFNFNPAKIFMGDTGSNFLGFVLAVISIQGTMKGYTAIAILVPLLVLGLPIFDTAFAIIRRVLSGKSPMEADRGHLHHRLLDAGYSQRQSVLLLYTISAFLGISAVIVTESSWVRALIVIAILIAFLVVGVRYLKAANNQNKG